MSEEACDHQDVTNIQNPHHHDILLGRGNLANRHPGNINFRSLVNSYKMEYIACPKSQKSIYPKLIYDRICSLDPPGRFLVQNPTTKLWGTVNKKKAIDKTRQALREGAPLLVRGLEGKKNDTVTSSTSREQGQTSSNNDSTFPQSQRYHRFLSGDSEDFSSFDSSPDNLKVTSNATQVANGTAQSSFAADMTSSQVSSERTIPTIQNNISSTDSELSAMLRSAHMELLQRHSQEWQQLSDMRSSMQNMGYADAQLQIQALTLQMQLQDAWKQMFQQDNSTPNQQQSAAIAGTAQQNPCYPNQQAIQNKAFQQVNTNTYQQAPSNIRNNTNPSNYLIHTTPGIYNNTYTVQATQTTNPSSHHPQQQAIAENIRGQNYSSWLSTPQTNLSGRNASSTEYHAVSNASRAHDTLHQQLQSQLALQALQSQLSQPKMNSNTNDAFTNNANQNHKDVNRVVAKSA